MELEQLKKDLKLNDQQVQDIHEWAKHIRNLKRYHEDQALILLNNLSEHKTSAKKSIS